MVFGFSHSLTLEAVASHHPTIRIGNRGYISFDVQDTCSSLFQKNHETI
jgi:hypothetical protein